MKKLTFIKIMALIPLVFVACTKNSTVNGTATSTDQLHAKIKGYLTGKYSHRPAKNAGVCIKKKTFDWGTLSNVYEQVGVAYTDDNGEFSYDLYYRDKSAKHVATLQPSTYLFTGGEVPINIGTDVHIEVEDMVTVNLSVDFHNNKYPPMSISVNRITLSNNEKVLGQMNGNFNTVHSTYFATPFTITYSNNNPDSLTSTKTKTISVPFADTIVLNDLVDMGF
ncbi:MAG: hypothetical protein JWQ38_3757 [Flavipsychrobacter sp.]|nr:hypothetical protein [Flavipsychrobacter sp.]